MKKKAKKKGIIPRQTGDRPRPPRVGGRLGGDIKLNWSKVGRKRLAENGAIEQLASSIKQLREEQGLTVAQMAKELGIAPATIIKFEDRAYPVSVKVVLGMAEKLNCTLEVKQKKSATNAGKKAAKKKRR